MHHSRFGITVADELYLSSIPVVKLSGQGPRRDYMAKDVLPPPREPQDEDGDGASWGTVAIVLGGMFGVVCFVVGFIDIACGVMRMVQP